MTTVPAGDYYLAVMSQGGTNVGATPTNQNGPQMGTGNAGYTILSRGGAQTAALGNLTVGGSDLTKAAETLGGGEVKMYSFTVPVGLASVQVSLENSTGNPYLGLPTVPDWLGRPNHTVGDYSENYGLDKVGTGAAVLQGPSFVTLANPTPGTYTVAVRASSTAEFGTFPMRAILCACTRCRRWS